MATAGTNAVEVTTRRRYSSETVHVPRTACHTSPLAVVITVVASRVSRSEVRGLRTRAGNAELTPTGEDKPKGEHVRDKIDRFRRLAVAAMAGATVVGGVVVLGAGAASATTTGTTFALAGGANPTTIIPAAS